MKELIREIQEIKTVDNFEYNDPIQCLFTLISIDNDCLNDTNP